jgi:hypothetical protein
MKTILENIKQSITPLWLKLRLHGKRQWLKFRLQCLTRRQVYMDQFLADSEETIVDIRRNYARQTNQLAAQRTAIHTQLFRLGRQ